MDNTLHLVGIAKKARRVEVGESPWAPPPGPAGRLIVLALRRRRQYRRRAAHFAEAWRMSVVQCPYSKEELGGAVGRTSCAMLAFTDAGLAASFMGKLSARDAERYGETAEAVSAKAARMLQRQREQRRHEQKLQKAGAKPWVAPASCGAERRLAQRGRGAPGKGGKTYPEAREAELRSLWAAARPWPAQWKIFAIEPPQSRGFAGRGEAGKRRGRFPPPRRRASSDVKERR